MAVEFFFLPVQDREFRIWVSFLLEADTIISVPLSSTGLGERTTDERAVVNEKDRKDEMCRRL